MSTAISKMNVGGFKTIYDRIDLDIKPLTLLTGANGNGKSSFMQPLLIMKQTLEAKADPGLFLIDGPHFKARSGLDFIPRPAADNRPVSDWEIGLQLSSGNFYKANYNFDPYSGFSLSDALFGDLRSRYRVQAKKGLFEVISSDVADYQPVISRCFVELKFGELGFKQTQMIEAVRNIIHIPNIPMSASRVFPLHKPSTYFVGPFPPHAASVIAQWQQQGKLEPFDNINNDLKRLGLTSNILSNAVSETWMELKIARHPHASKSREWINIADAGAAMLKVLPILVGLETARPDQMVYIEHPETFLSPRTQAALAEIFLRASTRGVQLVIETQSGLLLLALQTLLTEQKLPKNHAVLHRFTRNSEGKTAVKSSQLDHSGKMGDWHRGLVSVLKQYQGRYKQALADHKQT